MNVVTTVGNGENILGLITKHKPMIVLLDLGLRNQNSLSIVKLINCRTNKMKTPSKYLFIIKIVIIVLLSLISVWLFLHELYFSSLILFMLLIVLSCSLYNDKRKLINRMERMISAIRNKDFTFHYHQKDSNDELNRLSKEMNEALKVFRDHAYQSYKEEAEAEAWQKLISVLTHEIMNSIAPIISLSETLSKGAETTHMNEEECRNMRQGMQVIHRRSAGLLSFVKNYRRLTKIPQPLMQPIPVDNLLKSMQLLVEAEQIRFTYSCYPEQLLVRADRNMLEQILINLLRNAKESTENRPDPTISIDAKQVGKEVQIAVADNGTGISPEAINKVFIPFYSTKSKGSGIGLSLCRQMMMLHKGNISFSSDVGGTRFTLFFKV